MGGRASFSCAIHLGPFSRRSRALTLCFEGHTWLTVSSRSAVCKEERKQTPGQVISHFVLPGTKVGKVEENFTEEVEFKSGAKTSE